MGSRIRKPEVEPRLIDAYKQMNIHERINFKTWEYWYGRNRTRLQSIIKFKSSATVSSLQHFAAWGIWNYLLKPII